MDYIENKTKEELDLIVESIDIYLSINDYENAFIFFYTFGHLKRRFSKPCNSLIFAFLFYFSHIQHLCYMLL